MLGRLAFKTVATTGRIATSRTMMKSTKRDMFTDMLTGTANNAEKRLGVGLGVGAVAGAANGIYECKDDGILVTGMTATAHAMLGGTLVGTLGLFAPAIVVGTAVVGFLGVGGCAINSLRR